MPTRPQNGEGSTDGEASTHAAIRSAGVLGAARGKGETGNRGRPIRSEVAASTLLMAVDRAGVGQGRMTAEAE
jgi:hypothetical protein